MNADGDYDDDDDDDDNYDDDHQERVEGEWRRAPRLGCSCRAER